MGRLNADPAVASMTGEIARRRVEGVAQETACENCERPNRTLWTFGLKPNLAVVSDGDWNSLERCAECGSLWVYVPHEPYAAFPFWTWWPSDEANWSSLNDRDSRIIHEWHNAVIRETWPSLPQPEQAHVEHWRDRTYRGHNPIDGGPSFGQPAFVETVADLSKFTT